ncbi:MAG TPA: contractile injection system tape measure protein, partial [Sediminibacterium sp.]|nr:contractile injection system tape measure protein [Sediminibacterium sp.]
MAETQHFAMEALVWEILYSDKQGVHALQNRMSRLTNDRLINEISDTLEKIIPPTEQIIFDRLELDLGSVLLQDIETELPGRLMEALAEQINHYLEVRRKTAVNVIEEPDQHHPEHDIETLLVQLLETGLLPWWVAADQRQELAALVRSLLDTDKARLAEILRERGVQEPVRRRLAYQLSEDLLQQIIQVLEPTEAPYIIAYQQDVVKIQQQEQPVKAETAGFSRVLWFFILQYLLDDRGSEFNRKEFAERTLRQIAANYSISYFELLRLLYAAVRETINANHQVTTLEKLLEQLAIEAAITAQFPLQPGYMDTAEQNQEATAGILWQQLNLVAYYLQFGSLPPGTANYSADDLSAMLTQLAARIPRHFLQMLRELWTITDFSERYARLLGLEKMKQVFLAIAPASFEAIWQMSTLLDVFDRQYHLFDQAGAAWSDLRWKLVFHTFLTTVENKRTEKEAVGLLLQTFAKQTAVSFTTLLHAVQQKMREAFRFGIHDSQLPQWINALAPDEAFPDAEFLTPAMESAPGSQVTSYLDMLYFLIEFGYMPWWASAALKDKPLLNWLQTAADTSSEEVKKLLEWAGKWPVYRERLVQVLPEEVFTQWLTVLPQGRTLVKRALAMIHFVEQYFQQSGPLISKRILQSFWEDLVWNEYRYFRTPAVFSLALQKIAKDKGLPWQFLVLTISRNLPGTTPAATEDAVFVQVLQRLALAAWDENGEALQPELQPSQEQALVWQHPGFRKRFQLFFVSALPAGMAVIPPEIQEENSLFDHLQQTDQLLRNRIGELSNFLLQYFLIWGRLPDEFRSDTSSRQPIFIRQLLIIAFAADRHHLQELFLDKRFSDQAIRSLQSHIQAGRGGVDKQMADWLENAMKEQDMFMPLPVAGSSEISPAGIREELVRWLASDGVLTDAVLHHRVRQILDEFFATGQLPMNWPSEFRENLSGRLAALLILLFNENRLLLHNLLQQPYHLPAARIWLQELLRNETDSSVQQLLAFMEPYQAIYWRKQMVG